MCLDRAGRILLPGKKLRQVNGFVRARLSSLARHLHSLPLSDEQRLKALVDGSSQLLANRLMFRHHPALDFLFIMKDDEQLKELDRWLALTILQLTYRRGFKKGAFRRRSYRALRQMGLPSFTTMAKGYGNEQAP
jgi:hypothetical protein